MGRLLGVRRANDEEILERAGNRTVPRRFGRLDIPPYRTERGGTDSALQIRQVRQVRS